MVVFYVAVAMTVIVVVIELLLGVLLYFLLVCLLSLWLFRSGQTIRGRQVALDIKYLVAGL